MNITNNLNPYLNYKLENFFLDIFCYCLYSDIVKDIIFVEINFDYNFFKLPHHIYIMKKINNEKQEENIKYEKIFDWYSDFFKKYKEHYNNKKYFDVIFQYISINK